MAHFEDTFFHTHVVVIEDNVAGRFASERVRPAVLERKGVLWESNRVSASRTVGEREVHTLLAVYGSDNRD